MRTRSKSHATALFYLSWFSQKTRKGLEQIGIQSTKRMCGGKYTRARAPLARKYTNRIFESRDGTTSMEYWIRLKDTTLVQTIFLIMSSRKALQTYKVEERTFGTPCKKVVADWKRTVRSYGWLAQSLTSVHYMLRVYFFLNLIFRVHLLTLAKTTWSYRGRNLFEH